MMSDLRLMSCAGKREAEARRQDQKEFVAAKKRYAQMEALRVEMQRLGYEGVATARYKQLQTELKRLEREGSPPSSRTQRRARRGRSRRRSASAVAEGDERRASSARRSVSAERQSPRHDDEHLVRQMHGHKVQRTATGLTATTPDMQNGWWRSSPPRQRPAPRRSRSVSPGHSHPHAAYAARRSPARRSASGSRAIPAGRTFGTAARRTGWRAPGSLEQSMTDEARVAARRRRRSSWSARCVANGLQESVWQGWWSEKCACAGTRRRGWRICTRFRAAADTAESSTRLATRCATERTSDAPICLRHPELTIATQTIFARSLRSPSPSRPASVQWEDREVRDSSSETTAPVWRPASPVDGKPRSGWAPLDVHSLSPPGSVYSAAS